MKALQLIETGCPLEEREIPVPVPERGEVVVKVVAAGICHSDVHYRAGTSPAFPRPITLGHEVSGVVSDTGDAVTRVRTGDRVCLHYLVGCGQCASCTAGNERFCATVQMIGKNRDGGYAEYIRIPERSVVPLHESVPFVQGAVMMCSSSTALHAIHKSRLRAGESVAVFGVGGLGMSAVRLASLFEPSRIFAVDINRKKLELAESVGAVPVLAGQSDPVERIRELNEGHGVDVAIEMIGLPETMQQAVRSLGQFGRAVIAGLTDQPVHIDAYDHLITKEAEVIGVSDHTIEEIEQLLLWYREGTFDFPDRLIETVPLEAGAVNRALDSLDRFAGTVRTVIKM